MPAYIIRRLVSTLPVMATVGLVVFLLLHLAPGDPAAVIAGDGADSSEIARIHASLGLDRPLWVQFGIWLSQILRGDLGTSVFFQVPVLQLIEQRIGPTVALASLTILFSVTVGLLLGSLAAARAGGLLDGAVMVLATIGFSAPVFVVGYALILLFALDLDWLPVQGYTPPDQGIWPFLGHLALPALSLSFAYIALISRITRASLLEVLSQDYILTAYAKGFGELRVFTGHALRNAAVPIATIVGIGVALLISGVVVTETVFNVPGVGTLVVDAITRRDYPVIQGVTLVFAAVYVVINLLVDLACALFDPRIRY